MVTTLPTSPEPNIPGGRNAVSQARLSGVRRRQPLLRAQGSTHPVPAGQPQGRHRLHRRPRPHQDHGSQPGQRLHPQPDVRGGRPARRPGGLLPARQRRQELPRGDGQADEGHPRVPQPRSTPRGPRLARPRLHADVPDAGQPRRGASQGRSRPDPRHRARPQPVDVRDLAVQLRGPHLLHPGDQPGQRRPRPRRTRMVPGTRRQDRPGPARAGARLSRQPLHGPARVRPVLAGLRQGRHPGVDARLGQRLLPVPQRLGARRRVQAVRADRRSGWSRWASAPSRTPWRRWSATAP